jgi:hypothetical protein
MFVDFGFLIRWTQFLQLWLGINQVVDEDLGGAKHFEVAID